MKRNYYLLKLLFYVVCHKMCNLNSPLCVCDETKLKLHLVSLICSICDENLEYNINILCTFADD